MITEWFATTSSAFGNDEIQPKTNHESPRRLVRGGARASVWEVRRSIFAKRPAPDLIRLGAGFRSRSCAIESQTVTRFN
jgi:hypothetical protein